MDVLTAMSYFRRVVEAGSFSTVARELGTTQPTISKHVAALEQRLETKLLNRSTRQLNLTEAGLEYYKHCIRILDDVAESEASVVEGKSMLTGNLRITAPVMFGRIFIAPLLWEFQDKYPDISIEFIMNDAYIDLLKEGIDLAIRAGKLTDSNLVARKLGQCPEQALVASPAYLAKHGEPKTPADLKNHKCLVHSLMTPNGEWEFMGPQGKETHHVKTRFISNNRDTLTAAALADQGITISLLWTVSNQIKQGRLKRLLTNYTTNTMDFYAIYPERYYVPQKVRLLIEHISHYFDSSDQFREKVEHCTAI